MYPGIYHIKSDYHLNIAKSYGFSNYLNGLNFTESKHEACGSFSDASKEDQLGCCSEDLDDGYAQSEESNSYHSACETLTDSKSTASSTSGLASATSSNDQSEQSSIHNTEIVKKILVSREVNDAIFKPGNFIACSCSIDLMS